MTRLAVSYVTSGMVIGFWELLCLVSILLIFALAIIIPFVWHLHKKSETDRERSEACHNFQKELNRESMKGFNKNNEVLSLTQHALQAFLDHLDKMPKPKPPDDGKQEKP